MKVKAQFQNSESKTLKDVVFRKLFYESKDMFLIFDFVRDMCIDVNDSALKFSGYSREEFMQLSRSELTPKYSNFLPGIDLHTKYLQAHADKVTIGEEITEEGIFITKDGAEILADIEIIPTGRKRGEAFISIKDKTERFKKTIKFQESERKYQSIVESTQAGITIVDMNGNHTYASPQIKKVSGYSEEDLIGKPSLRFFPERSHPALKEYTQRLLSGDESSSMILIEAYHKKGHSMWFQGSGVLLKDSEGNPTGIQTFFLNVTDRILLERQLTRTNEKYQRIIENLEGIFVIVDMKGYIEFVSPNFTNALGYSQEEAVGQKGLFVFSEEDAELIKVQSEKIINGEIDSYQGTFKSFHKDGSAKWFNGTFSMTKDKQGEYNGFVSVYFDVTKEKILAQKLISSEDKNNYLFNSSIQPIIIRDLKTLQIVDCNEAALRFFNLEDKSKIEELNKLAQQVSNDEGKDFKEIVKDQLAIAETKGSATFQANYKDEDGNAYIIEINLVKDHSDPESPTCVFFLKDVTDQVLTFEKVRRERELLNAVLEGVPDHIVVENSDRKVIAVNSNFKKSFKEVHNINVEIGSDMRGLVAQTNTFMHENPADWENKIHRVLNGNSFEHQYAIGHNNKRFHKNMTVSPLKDGDENVVGIIGAVRDITELVEKNEEIADKNEELQKYIDSNIQLENFAYIASHDLKQPLRTIMSFSELLKNKKASQLDEDSNVYINFILNSAKRLDNLVNDMLSYSIIGTDGTKENIDLHKLAMQVVLDLDTLIKQTNTTVNIVSIPKTIHGLKTEITSLFLNLISNAIKYSKPDVYPVINISVEENENQWKFLVEDNGIGIASNHLDKIFGMFQRLETHDDASGTGIGLAQCKKIVELHEGEIWAESVVGIGTKFYFTIPQS